MSYTELRELIQAYINTSDWEAILALITVDNVNTAVACNKNSYSPPVQRLTNGLWMVEQYEQLKADIIAAGTVNDVIAYFLPHNILLAGVGREYEELLAVTTAVKTDLGYASPGAEAETSVKEYYEFKTLLSNEPPTVC